MRKAKYLFARIDLDGTEVDPDVILKKRMPPVQNSLERCEVLVSNEKLMELKFNKPKQVLELCIHNITYGLTVVRQFESKFVSFFRQFD